VLHGATLAINGDGFVDLLIAMLRPCNMPLG
jgi:hypothetical protein